jgi:hypothetical protein
MEADVNIWKTQGLKSANKCALHIMVSWVMTPSSYRTTTCHNPEDIYRRKNEITIFFLYLINAIVEQKFLARLIQERRE